MSDKLSRTFDIEVNGKAREVFMSFGLLNELTTILGDVDRLTHLLVDTDLRNRVLSALLAERSKAGKIQNRFDLEDLDLDPTDVVSLIGWASEWILDFFVRSGEAIKAVFDKNAMRVASLIPSVTGTVG